MAERDEKPDEPEDTKVEEAEEVGLEGLARDKQDGDAPPPEETRTPFDEA